jgi:hypothetical protein
MRTVVYIAPFPMAATLKFAKALASLQNVRLIGVFQKPPSKGHIHLFHRIITVSDAFRIDLLMKAIKQIQSHYGDIHRIVGILEQLQETIAFLRQKFGVSGVSPNVARNFRDKATMKDILLAAGIPCAKYRRINSIQEAWSFVDEVGFPIVLKPPEGAGCKATYRVSHPSALIQAMNEIPTRPVLAEEFLTGVEHSMESFVLNGQPLFSSFSRYYPSPLEVVEKPWIQWVVHFPKEVSDPKYKRAQQIGYAAIRALGLDTGMTHMEWFSRTDGRIAIGEIGARPPGAQFAECTGLVHGMDAHRVWARLVVDGEFDGPWQRNTSVAIAFLRGQGTGKVSKIEGIDEAQSKMGDLVVDLRLPKIGAIRSGSYEGEGWVIIQHENSEIVKKAALELITTVRVHYEH